VLSVASLVAGPAGALQDLFASTNKGELVQLDLAAGTATLVGSAVNHGWPGISFNAAGDLYVSSRWSDETPAGGCIGVYATIGGCSNLYRLDPSSGAVQQQIGSTGVAFLSDLDFGDDGTLYGNRYIDQLTAGDGGLVTIDLTTGAASPAPNPRFGQGLENGGLSFHPFTGILWAVESNFSHTPRIFAVDPATGLAISTPVVLGLNGQPSTFGFDGLEILLDGTFIATRAGQTSELYEIDPNPDPVSGLAEVTQIQLAVDPGISGGMKGLDLRRLSLAVTPPQLSLAAGGTQTMLLNAGPAQALRLFLLLGSSSGTSPGLPVDGVVLPLVIPDPYFTFTLSNPNTPPLGNSFGTLTATGQSIASFVVPAGSSPTFAGVTLNHAYVVFDTTSTPGSPTVAFASNPVDLTLVP
jgi:hypothetical protein